MNADKLFLSTDWEGTEHFTHWVKGLVVVIPSASASIRVYLRFNCSVWAERIASLVGRECQNENSTIARDLFPSPFHSDGGTGSGETACFMSDTLPNNSDIGKRWSTRRRLRFNQAFFASISLTDTMCNGSMMSMNPAWSLTATLLLVTQMNSGCGTA